MEKAAAQCPRLTIRWVKGHRGHEGNVLADTAARQGRDNQVAPDWESPLLAKAVMHAEIDKMATRLWENDWNEYIGGRQTRHFFPTGPRPGLSRDIMYMPRIILGQLIQILTGHTYLKRHQAIIDETERQRIISALKTTEGHDYPNADDDGNAIIDAPDPTCGRCNSGLETPLHLLSECDALGTLRKDIFGREDLVAPGEIPDFSNLKIFQIVSFFREAKFETLSMHPFLDQYLPTEIPGNKDDQSMRDRKSAGTKAGKTWTSKYLYRIPYTKTDRLKTTPVTNNDNNNTNDDHNNSDEPTDIDQLL